MGLCLIMEHWILGIQIPGKKTIGFFAICREDTEIFNS